MLLFSASEANRSTRLRHPPQRHPGHVKGVSSPWGRFLHAARNFLWKSIVHWVSVPRGDANALRAMAVHRRVSGTSGLAVARRNGHESRRPTGRVALTRDAPNPGGDANLSANRWAVDSPLPTRVRPVPVASGDGTRRCSGPRHDCHASAALRRQAQDAWRPTPASTRRHVAGCMRDPAVERSGPWYDDVIAPRRRASVTCGAAARARTRALRGRLFGSARLLRSFDSCLQ